MSGALQAVYMNQRSFTIPPYFFGRIGETTVNQADNTPSVVFDTANNFITAGYQSGANTAATIFKIDPKKATVFEKKYTQTSISIQFEKVATDSSDNIYTVGSQNASGIWRMLITKVNSSGVLQWSRRLGISTGQVFGIGIGTDSSGNVYVAGYAQLTSSDKYAFLVAKYNSSGTIQWQRKLYQSVGNNITQGFATDSSGNSYVSGYSLQVTGPPATYYGYIAKYNSSGTLQWQKQFSAGGAGSFGNINFSKVDSSGNIYSGCSNYNASTPATTIFLQKLDSSGNVQWQRSYSDSSMQQTTLDSSNNVYFCGESVGGANYRGHIVKYNSSGTIQWQRVIDATLSGQNFKYWYAIGTDPNDQLGVAGITGQAAGGGNNNLGMIARYPNDGAFTGAVTVGGTTYTTTTAVGTDAAFTMSLSNASLTDSAGGFTDESVTLTEATITTPVALVNI
jgi:hypothetical protein